MLRKPILILLAILLAALANARAEQPALFDLVLTSCDNEARAAKAVNDISGLNIKDAKVLVGALPKAILSGVTQAEAEGAKRHAESMGCKLEIRAAQPGASTLPAHKFDVVLLKADPGKKDALKQALTNALNTPGQPPIDAQEIVDHLPRTIMTNVSLTEADLKIDPLEGAGGTLAVVGTGGVETGGYSVVLNGIDPKAKIVTVAVVREFTGLNLARAKALVDTLPKTVKIKVTKDEADKIKAAFEAHKAVVVVKESGK